MCYRTILIPFVLVVRFKRYIANVVYYPLKTIIFKVAFGLACDNTVRFIGKTIIRGYGRGSIVIGANTRFVSGTENNLRMINIDWLRFLVVGLTSIFVVTGVFAVIGLNKNERILVRDFVKNRGMTFFRRK